MSFTSAATARTSGCQVFILPAVPDAVRVARATVRRFLSGTHTSEELAEQVLLVASELITNAIVHGRGRAVHCALTVGSTRLTLEVTDEGGDCLEVTSSTQGERDQEAQATEHGRGLLLVAACTDAWGTEPAFGQGAGCSVWARWELGLGEHRCSG